MGTGCSGGPATPFPGSVLPGAAAFARGVPPAPAFAAPASFRDRVKSCVPLNPPCNEGLSFVPSNK